MATWAEAAIVPTVNDETVRVELGARAYDVVVGMDLLDGTGARLTALGFRGRAGLVTSDRVGALYRGRLERSLRLAGFEPILVEVPDGEAHKTLATLERVYDVLLRAGVDRATPLVALGGGVIGDLTGFAAATLLRGLPLVQVPTTLLAQVDAAIGGKTAVDHAVGKNLIGAFHQPRLVLADVGALATLPRRELLAGLAEVVKYGIIGDAASFARLERDPQAALTLDPGALVPMVAACARQKAAVVAADEREADQRALLNLGHTFGHAFEVAAGFSDRLLHGEAIGLGMALAFEFSARRGLIPQVEATRAIAHLAATGLPTHVRAVPGDWPGVDAMMDLISQDKKVKRGRLTFILLRGIGAAYVARDVDAAEVRAFLAEKHGSR
jgi:3-dehydroquinate synthase